MYCLKTKAYIIDVLGEEMYNVCIEYPDKAVAFSWLFSFSIAEFDEAQGIDSMFSNRLLEIREELGEELCNWYSKNYKELGNLITILNSYVDSYEHTKKTKEELQQLIHSIDSRNFDAKIIPLIIASGISDETNKLSNLFARTNICCIRDLFRILALKIDEQDNVELMRFLKWLSEDKLKMLRDGLQNLFKNARDKEIIQKRAYGATLEETSTDHGLTHEGVRLIEKKFQGRFNSYILNVMPHYIINAFSKNVCYISIDNINKTLGELSDIFTYYLNESNCSTAQWSNQLNGFIIGDGKWYKRLKAYREGLPKMFDYESVDELIADIIDKLTLPITFEDTKRLVLVDYNLTGKVYLKKKTSLTQMYYAVLEKYYPDGIKLYDDFEAIRFRNYMHSLFGDVYLPENNRAIAVRLTDLTILCDKGKRILPSGIKISTELLRKIHDAIIEFDRNEIMFRALFERFKNELLENSNITNKYFLQGVLKQNYASEFNFTRHTVRKELSCSTSPAK